jgi:hypothetical protein
MTASTGKSGQDILDRTSRKGQLGYLCRKRLACHYSLDGTERTEYPGQYSKDKIVGTEQRGQENRDRTARTGQPV